MYQSTRDWFRVPIRVEIFELAIFCVLRLCWLLIKFYCSQCAFILHYKHPQLCALCPLVLYHCPSTKTTLSTTWGNRNQRSISNSSILWVKPHYMATATTLFLSLHILFYWNQYYVCVYIHVNVIWKRRWRVRSKETSRKKNCTRCVSWFFDFFKVKVKSIKTAGNRDEMCGSRIMLIKSHI